MAQAKAVQKTLLDTINEIDAQTVAKGTPQAGGLWALMERGKWQKGKAVIKFYPTVEEVGKSKGGRPRKTEGRQVSYRSIAEELGRSADSIKRWVKLVITVGKSDEAFAAYIKEGRAAQEAHWQRKLIASDLDRKEPEPNVRKQVEDRTFAAVMERFKEVGDLEEADVKYLIERVQRLVDSLTKVLKALQDENVERALQLCQEALVDTDEG